MDESITFTTIISAGEGFYKEKGSKFYGHAFPVNSEEEVKNRLEELRKTYYDARHHCFAYRIGLDQPLIRANDDGEPNHSAGDPILGQIRSFNLTNVLIVVIRYFGGTKLGVGGLIHAYKTAAEEALTGLETVEIFEKIRFSVNYVYEQTPTVERFIQQVELFDIQRRFEETCSLSAEIRIDQKEAVEKRAIDMQLTLQWES